MTDDRTYRLAVERGNELQRIVDRQRKEIDELKLLSHRAWIFQQAPIYVTDAQLDPLVSRFLSWKIPDDFAPDCGITFRRHQGSSDPDFPAYVYEPTGTNLFHAEQARDMIRHILGYEKPLALPAPDQAT